MNKRGKSDFTKRQKEVVLYYHQRGVYQIAYMIVNGSNTDRTVKVGATTYDVPAGGNQPITEKMPRRRTAFKVL